MPVKCSALLVDYSSVSTHFFRTSNNVRSFSQKSKSGCPCKKSPKLKHLVCFKNWTPQMVFEILSSALNLKCQVRCDIHNKKLKSILPDAKIMILQERNEPMLNMAVSKATALLGASDVNITDKINWDCDYNGRIFSEMADVIFVSTKSHTCIQKFANRSIVPVLCMRSRTHASIQALATIMSIMETYGTMQGINMSYVGPPHPILNSYLLLAPMCGANITFKCCCSRKPVSPLLINASKSMTEKTSTVVKQVTSTEESLKDAMVVIAGPTSRKKENIPKFILTREEISKCTCYPWSFYHTCPRGKEVNDSLFWSDNSKTFNAFTNMQYIAAALMADAIRSYKF